MSATPKVLLLATALSCLLLAGCRDTLNVGGPTPPVGPRITAFNVVPLGTEVLQSGGQAEFTVAFQASFASGPFTMSIDYGGSVTPNLNAAPAERSPFTTTVTLVELASAQSFTATARLTDRYGITSGPQTLTFNVQPPPNNLPSIDSLVVQDDVVTVTVSDPDGDPVTVTLDHTSGNIYGAPASRVGSGDFMFFPEIFPGVATGTATFTADDGRGGRDTETSGEITAGAPPALADGLGAIPLATSATVDDTVLVVVSTGAVAWPFQFMSGVSVVFPPGCEYVPGSFDFGAPPVGAPSLNPDFSADQDTVDGIWTTVAPTAGFLPVGDNLLPVDTDLPAPHTGSSAVDFNITPLGGQDTPAGTSGILFNFRLRFTQPGSYKLGFLLEDGYQRTYYEDALGNDRFWGDITNSVSQGTVNVTP